MPGSGPPFGHAVTGATSMTDDRRDKGCSSSMARPTSSVLRRAALAATATTMLLALSGCTGDDGDDSEGGPGGDTDSPSGTPAGPPPLATHTTMGVVSGKLPDDTRARLKSKIAVVVDDWI